MKKIIRLLICLLLCTLVRAYSDTPRKVIRKTSPSIQQTSEYSLEVSTEYENLNQAWSLIFYEYKNSSSSLQQQTIIVAERNAKLWVLQGELIREIEGLPSDVKQFKKGGLEQPGWLDLEQGSDGWIYLSYARKKGRNDTVALISFQLDEQALINPEKSIRAIQVRNHFESNTPKSTRRHHGGAIAVLKNEYNTQGIFGTKDTKHDMVLLALGARADREAAQDIRIHNGNILLIDPESSNVETISYGHRNPQGLFFDFRRNIVYSTEHGPQGGDEVNLIEQGKNYGWAVISYGKEYGSGKQVGVGTHKEGMEQALYHWEYSPALSGMLVYYGDTFSQWKGNILIAALKLQQIYMLSLSNNGRVVVKEETLLNNKFGRIRNLALDTEGNIYFVTDHTDGKLFKISRKE